MNRDETCPHFQTRIEKLPLELTTALLPIRRCLLAERMIRLVRSKPEAESVVETFVRDPALEVPYCVCGPDLDTIEHSKCVKTRCETEPAFNRQTLQLAAEIRALIESFQSQTEK